MLSHESARALNTKTLKRRSVQVCLSSTVRHLCVSIGSMCSESCVPKAESAVLVIRLHRDAAVCVCVQSCAAIEDVR